MSQQLEVRQHNAFTNARYDYSELQQDLLFFIISKLQKDNKESYSLSIMELSKLTGKKYNAAYLHKATADMGARVFEVLTEKSYKQIWMFQQVEYQLGRGIIEFDLTRHILPYLFDLKDNFTSYELAAALRLGSKYAKRIYQLCSQWKDVGETRKYDLRDFKRMLGLLDEKGSEKMKQIKELRERVLDVAVRQINEHTELRVSYALEKVGRRFQHIGFTVKPQALAEAIPFDLTPTGPPLPGVQPSHYDNAARVLDELRISGAGHRQAILASADLIAEVNRYNHDLKTGKIKPSRNPGGLLLVRLGLVTPKTAPPAQQDSGGRGGA